MADEPTEGNVPKSPAEDSDEFEGLVFDDDFVRGGTFEPPARTRLAIAKYGDQATSWRQGGVRKPQAPRAPNAETGRERRPRQRVSSRPSHPALPSSAMARLPLIITVVVVAIAAFLVFR